MTQTLNAENLDISYHSYVIDVSKATTDINTIILLLFRYFGAWGNSIFFICSAWFLLRSSSFNKKKWFFMLVEIWSVSVLILTITYPILHGGISTKIIIKSFFPTLFANNWYMTCYLLFYPIHPLLNVVIKRMSQVQLFRSTTILTLLYVFIDFIKDDCFFPSRLILWMAIYFIIAYMQKYLMKYADNTKMNLNLIIFNIICLIVLTGVTEVAGLHFKVLNGQMKHWVSLSNPFLIFASIAMFNIARNVHFTNKFINYISSLSLLIYIIHENVILLKYFRPAMWNYVYHTFGYAHVIEWVFVLSIVVFVFGILAAVLYTAILKRPIFYLCDRMYCQLRRKYLSFEGVCLNR